MRVPLIEKLIAELSKLPNIGHKTATRLALHILKSPPSYAVALSAAIREAREKLTLCRNCFYLTEDELCQICIHPHREAHTLCIVEDPSDVIAIERSGQFRGLYHILHGSLSPLEGIGPEELKIKELIHRLHNNPHVQEIILALGSSVEGETTTLYLSKLLKPLKIRLTKIAHGIPMGGELEYLDEMTIGRAFENRRDI